MKSKLHKYEKIWYLSFWDWFDLSNIIILQLHSFSCKCYNLVIYRWRKIYIPSSFNHYSIVQWLAGSIAQILWVRLQLCDYRARHKRELLGVVTWLASANEVSRNPYSSRVEVWRVRELSFPLQQLLAMFQVGGPLSAKVLGTRVRAGSSHFSLSIRGHTVKKKGISVP